MVDLCHVVYYALKNQISYDIIHVFNKRSKCSRNSSFLWEIVQSGVGGIMKQHNQKYRISWLWYKYN